MAYLHTSLSLSLSLSLCVCVVVCFTSLLLSSCCDPPDNICLNSPDFAEYAQLHKFISSMQAAFVKFDRDRNGRLDKLEIMEALKEGGFQFSQTTINTLVKKFASSDKAHGGKCHFCQVKWCNVMQGDDHLIELFLFCCCCW